MAIVLVMTGGILGFISGLVSFVLLNATLLQAVGVWMGSGLIVSGLALAIALLPDRAEKPAQLA